MDSQKLDMKIQVYIFFGRREYIVGEEEQD